MRDARMGRGGEERVGLREVKEGGLREGMREWMGWTEGVEG